MFCYRSKHKNIFWCMKQPQRKAKDNKKLQHEQYEPVLCCLVCNCYWLTVCIVVVVLCVCFYLVCICCTMCALLFFTLDAGLLARIRYSEGPATGHLDTGFAWFPCVYKQMLRWFPRFQVATTCFSCSPPDLHLLVTNFIFCIHVK